MTPLDYPRNSIQHSYGYPSEGEVPSFPLTLTARLWSPTDELHRGTHILRSPVTPDVVTSLLDLDLYKESLGDSVFYGHS